MGGNERTPSGADKFRVGAENKFHKLAEEAVQKNTGASFELVQNAFGLGDCSEEETREAWGELEKRGYRPHEIDTDGSSDGLSVDQIMDQLERQKKE